MQFKELSVLLPLHLISENCTTTSVIQACKNQGCGSGYFSSGYLFYFLHLSLPLPHLSLPLTKNEKTTVDNFFNFCGSVACLLLHFIILRKQKPLFVAITLPTSLELIVPNYSVFLLLRY